MSVETISLSIPQQLYNRIKRFAEITNQPIEKVLVQTISRVPTLPENLPESVTAKLVAIEELDDEALWSLAAQKYEADKQIEYSTLLHRQSSGKLTLDEQQQLESHFDAVNLLTLQKSYAFALLKWRGHEMPIVPQRTKLQ